MVTLDHKREEVELLAVLGDGGGSQLLVRGFHLEEFVVETPHLAKLFTNNVLSYGPGIVGGEEDCTNL